MFGHAKHLSRQWTRWKSFTWFLSQHLTRILLKTVICCSHPISHKAWHCYLSQTISNINTWRPWLLFTGPVNIHDVFIPRITARDCCNVILFEASTSLCFWTHQSCSKYKLLSSHSFVNVKVKVKFILEQDTKALEGKYFSFNLGATWGGGGQRHALAVLPKGKTRYPLNRRLGGPQSRSEQVWKISPQLGFDPRTVQPVGSRYTDWAIPAPFISAGNSSKLVAHVNSILVYVIHIYV